MGTLARSPCNVRWTAWGSSVWRCAVLLTASAAALAKLTTDANIRSLQTHLKMYPTDFKAYDQLGAAYIQKGRETADASYYELAKEALNKSLDLVSNDPAAASAKTHMAVVAMAEHQFEEALSWAQEALALGSGDPSPWAIVGDALTDMGEYDRAAEAYARLRDPLSPQGMKRQGWLTSATVAWPICAFFGATPRARSS